MQDFGSGDGGSNPPGGTGDGVLEPRHCFTGIVEVVPKRLCREGDTPSRSLPRGTVLPVSGI
jgi:hypothetical protein